MSSKQHILGSPCQKAKLKIIQKILRHPDNRTCADCSANEPTWASLKYGVWVCLNCSGYHRCIGAVHTRIQSAYLDQWSHHSLEVFSSLTNAIANAYWEAKLNPQVDKKPDPDHKPKEGLDFVKKKYLERKFIAPDSKNPAAHYLEFRHLVKHEDDELPPTKKKMKSFDLDMSKFARANKKSPAASTNIFEGMKIRCKKRASECEGEATQNRKTPKQRAHQRHIQTITDPRAHHRHTRTITDTGDHERHIEAIAEMHSPPSKHEIPPEESSDELDIIKVRSLQFLPARGRSNEKLDPKKRRNSARFYNRSISKERDALSPWKHMGLHEMPTSSSYEPLSLSRPRSRESSTELEEIFQNHFMKPFRTEFEFEEGVTLKKLSQWNRDYKKPLVLGSFLMHLAIGSLCAWGALVPYIVSYLRGHMDYHIIYYRLFLLQIIGFSLGLPFGVQLGKKFGFRKILIVVSVICCGAIFVSSYVTQSFVFSILFAFFPGICCGLMYMIPIYCVWESFPKKFEIITGVINSGFGVSAIASIGLCYWLMKPGNFVDLIQITVGLRADDSGSMVTSNAPLILKAFSTFLLVLMLAGAALISSKVTSGGIAKCLLDDEHLTRHPSEYLYRHSECATVKSGLKSSPFRFLFVIMMLSSVFGFYVFISYNHFKDRKPLDQNLLIYTWGGSILVNGFSRIFWAKLLERTSFRTVSSTALMIQNCLIVILGLHGKYIFCYPVVIIGASFCLGFSFSVFPLEAKRLFGMKHCSELYGLLYWAYPLVILLVHFLNHFLLPLIGEQTILGLFLILTAIGCYFCNVMDQNPQWEPEALWVELQVKQQP